MKAPAWRPSTLAGLGILALLAAPAASRAAPQDPPEEKSGGLARTEEELGALGRLAEMPDQASRKRAVNAYNLGLEHRDRARRLQARAAASAGDEAARIAAKARRRYEKAVEQFRQAVELEPGFHQALGSLGQVLLETGQHEEAIEAYDRALEIGPVYPEAIAERAEACLGLDRIEEAKQAYSRLLPVDREAAAGLMAAMQRWLERRRGDPGGVSRETIESFAVWIEEHGGPVPRGARPSTSEIPR